MGGGGGFSSIMRAVVFLTGFVGISRRSAPLEHKARWGERGREGGCPQKSVACAKWLSFSRSFLPLLETVWQRSFSGEMWAVFSVVSVAGLDGNELLSDFVFFAGMPSLRRIPYL